MSGFFGGGSAGSFLQASAGAGLLLSETLIETTQFAFDVGARVSTGRILRVRAQFLYSTTAPADDFVTFRFIDSSPDGEGELLSVSTDSDGGAVTLGTAILEVIAVALGASTAGGYTYLFQYRIGTGAEGADANTAIKGQRNNIPFVELATQYQITAQLSSDTDLSVQMLYSTAEILRAP